VTSTTTFALVLVAVAGLAVTATGVLFGTLGLWGVERGSPGAWLLALIGLFGTLVGAAFVVWAFKRMRNASGTLR
jgi:hypothetical protein